MTDPVERIFMVPANAVVITKAADGQVRAYRVEPDGELRPMTRAVDVQPSEDRPVQGRLLRTILRTFA